MRYRFRGFNLTRKEWVFGNGVEIMPNAAQIHDKKEPATWSFVDPETVGVEHVLNDSKCTKVYQGDILKYSFEHKGEFYNRYYCIKENSLENHVEIIPYIPHEKVIIEQSSSQVLLLFVNNSPNAKGILTGKIFEYMASGRPILAIGPKDGDTAIILDETKSGVIVDFEDKEGMKEVILDLFSKYKANQLITKENESVKKYSRRALAKEYVNLIERILRNEQN